MRLLISCVVVIGFLFVSGCGGGSGGSIGPASAPSVTLSITGCKQLHLEWDAVANADHYRVLESPDGSTDFAVMSSASHILTTSITLNIPVHKTDWVNTQYIVEACNAGDTITVPSAGQGLGQALSVAATGYFKASNTEANDQFGYSVALSADGNTLAVGAYAEDNFSGAVYLFSRSGTIWTQQAFIKASNTQTNDQFGYSVALSADGHTLAVGANVEESSATGINNGQADNGASDAGAVYIFFRSGTTWTQQAYIKASNTGAGDYFGYSVTLCDDGNTLAVGAREEESSATGINGDQADNGASNAGAVYIFSRSGTTWTQQAYIKASNTEAYDYFGISVALTADGNTLAVGGYREASNATGIDGNQDNNDASNAGAVYIFSRSGTTWTQQAYIKASNTEANDRFGASVTLSADGNSLAVGAYAEDSSATGINSDQADNGAIDSGAVYIFSRSGTTWTQLAYIKASNTEANDNFGVSVTLSADGNTLAVGAYDEDSSATGINSGQAENDASNAGAVYIFSRSGTTWTQQAYIKASNTEAYDYFGISVALTADGNTLAIGAFAEDSSATGINSDQADNGANGAGAVYLY